MFYPYLEHLLEYLNTRFPPELKQVMCGAYLMNLHKTGGCDMLSTNFEQEVYRWVHKYKDTQPDHLPNTLEKALHHCNLKFYQNMYSVFTLLLAFPVGSCACER